MLSYKYKYNYPVFSHVFRTFKIKIYQKKNAFTGIDKSYSAFLLNIMSRSLEQNILIDPQKKKIMLFP